ncbi:MAG: ribonuclease P protein component 1 [Candidatus Altiarchaeota archaeon]|nr:ribonuclease P protein component 1 [Candidatus Altiarchaeota archaeon]
MITPHNILRHELTGLKAAVVEATHTGYKCSGVIIAETRNTLKIKNGECTKTIPKDCIKIEVRLPGGGSVRLDGRLITSRPEDRIKKKHRIKFV